MNPKKPKPPTLREAANDLALDLDRAISTVIKDSEDGDPAFVLGVLRRLRDLRVSAERVKRLAFEAEIDARPKRAPKGRAKASAAPSPIPNVAPDRTVN